MNIEGMNWFDERGKLQIDRLNPTLFNIQPILSTSPVHVSAHDVSSIFTAPYMFFISYFFIDLFSACASSIFKKYLYL